MRRVVILSVLLALGICSSAAAAPVFFVWGKGWGHGIGMPQYGAYGYAQHGKSYTWILDHFYTGTEAGHVRMSNIRVLLDTGRSSVTLHSPSSWTVRDGRGRSWTLAAGTRTIGRSLRMTINGSRKRLVAPVTFRRPRGRSLAVDGSRYRGSIVLRKPGSRLAIVNVLGLQPYLYGVVPWEMPASWHPEALKAQAVAARSYGLANKTSGTYFDVYDDTRDQVYGGVRAEHRRTNTAVRATANEIRTYGGSIATTFFYSSSGGRTAANEDVWGGSPLPYLRSVPDRWDRISPYHTWGPTRYSRAAMDSALGGSVAGTLRDLRVRVNRSLRAGTVRIVGTGGTSSLGGYEVREVLGLRSSWFRIGVLNLVRARPTVVYGSRARLTGLARSVGGAWLETRRPGGSWRKVRDLELTNASRFSTSVKPYRARQYRVNSAKGGSNGRLVRVATKVRFYKPKDRTELTGVVRPRRSNLLVTIQRLEGGTWKRVKRGRTHADGDFSIAFDVENGRYRAVATVAGLARGVTPILTVTG